MRYACHSSGTDRVDAAVTFARLRHPVDVRRRRILPRLPTTKPRRARTPPRAVRTIGHCRLADEWRQNHHSGRPPTQVAPKARYARRVALWPALGPGDRRPPPFRPTPRGAWGRASRERRVATQFCIRGVNDNSPPGPRSTTTRVPDGKSPARTFRARGSSMCRWIARFSGRAPY
jgi:hypothetical protein